MREWGVVELGAQLIEPDDVPRVVERRGLFYLVRGDVELSAYRPAELLEFVRRADQAYKAWAAKPSVVVPAKSKRAGH